MEVLAVSFGVTGQVMLVMVLVFGLYMAWSIGANDVANAMGTSVGSRVLTLRQAIIIAAVMELAGAALAGGHVTDTVRKGIFDPSGLPPQLVAMGFISSLLAAAVWLQVATWFGWPVSTTHSIVGSIVGIGIMIGGVQVIEWRTLGKVVLSWVTSPLCGGLCSFVVLAVLKRLVLSHSDAMLRLQRVAPGLAFYVFFILGMVLFLKGLKNVDFGMQLGRVFVSSCVLGFVGAVGTYMWLRRSPKVESGEGSSSESHAAESNRLFGFLIVLSACFLAFAHGANDVANAIGPVAGVIQILRDGTVNTTSIVSFWILALGGIGIVIGLATWGYRVIETVGSKIMNLNPLTGFVINLGAATTIVLASRLGFPISTTHTLIGAVLGVGLFQTEMKMDVGKVKEIIVSWLITVPSGAILAIAFYSIFKVTFGLSG
ncbi:MAG: Low-affinity inorganic phosphate transporter 1 [Verrucomicrobia subdivision 3 bacterium]|nr:Low-affinity inorganic phosphate transporter 1 [Limisphaerales bacterium]